MQIPQEIQNSIPFQYAKDVSSGKIVCGIRIKQAVKRFYKWIETADEDGYEIDFKKAKVAINFFPALLNHTKGSMVGKPFELAPFQQFTIFNVFGWVHKKTGRRRIRRVYDKRGRGNGKTAEMAGLCLLMQSFENESQSEVYIIATKEAQAKICWKFAKNYIIHQQANPMLKKLGFRVNQREIFFDPLTSVMEPLGKESKTQDGLSAHFLLVDEYHAHASDELKEVLESSMLKREQPLTYHITTAGFNVFGVCKMYEDMCLSVLEGVNKDDNLFIMIHDLDEGDDWQLQENWEKSNPLWNYGLNLNELKDSYKDTINQPSKIPNFQTKHLNMWVDAPTVWVESKYWDACMVPIQYENFAKLGNCGGLDLSSTTDITAFAVVSEPDAEGFRDLEVWCFCPLDTIEKRSKEDRVPYRYWSNLKRENAKDDNDTYLIATPGNMVDYRVVFNKVEEICAERKTKHVEYDRKFSAGLILPLQEAGIELSPFTQTLMNYTSPTKEFERLLMSAKLRSGNNPILKWMLSGCVPITDTNENVRLDKSKSTKRIDGIIASIMAIAGTLSEEKEPETSKYNDPDVEIVLG